MVLNYSTTLLSPADIPIDLHSLIKSYFSVMTYVLNYNGVPLYGVLVPEHCLTTTYLDYTHAKMKQLLYLLFYRVEYNRWHFFQTEKNIYTLA